MDTNSQDAQASQTQLLASQARLERHLVKVEGERDALESDVQNVTQELEALDALLAKIEAQRIQTRKRLAELYQTNARLRQQLVPKGGAIGPDKPFKEREPEKIEPSERPFQ